MKIKEFSENTKVLLPTSSETKQVFTICDALAYIVETGNTYLLNQLMFYNVPVRDAIRNNGIVSVVDTLLEYAPDNEDLKRRLENYTKKDVHMADFDIQVLPITAELKFFGQRICYDQLRRIPEITRRIGRWTSESERENAPLHVGKIFEPYPCFDSFDAGDDRDYETFIIRDHKITEEECMEIEKAPYGSNCFYITENLPPEYLPVVYHDGYSSFLYVATAKDNPQITPEELG